MKKIISLSIILVLAVMTANAQSFYRKGINRKVVLYGTAGMSSYLGELTNPGDIFDDKINFGVGLEYYAYDRFSIRTGLQWFRIAASDFEADPERTNRGIRNLSFRSDNLEWMIGGAVYLFSNDETFTKRNFINPYILVGAGLVSYNPRAELNGKYYSLRPLKTEGIEYGRFALCYPIGGGLRIKVASFLDLSLEAAYRFTNTDYLDDISNDYIAQDEYISETARLLGDRRWEIEGQNLADPGDDRGNPEFNDGYLIATAKLAYYIPSFNLFGNNVGGSRFKLQGESMNHNGKYKYKTSKGGKIKESNKRKK